MTDELFKVKRFEEPEVQFDDGSAVSPKRGLYKYGPRLENDEHHTITVGVIGDRVAVRRLNDLFAKMETPIHPDDDDGKIRPWRVPFPGTGPRSKLDVSISMRDRWTRRIHDAMLDGLETYDTPKEKMDYFLNRVDSEVDLLSSDDPRPDIIVVCIPEKVIDECTPENQEYAKPSADGSDLHDRIKILGMEHSIPTQLIKPSTLDISNDRQRASRAWNLTVGMLYKAQEGHPWKTKELEEGACYAGISFYKDRGKDGNIVRAALAHVFARKDYTILQSEPKTGLTEDQNGRPHLSKEGASQIANRIVRYYKNRNRDRKPERLVIHKTSPFWQEEREGLIEGSSSVSLHDFVHIKTKGASFRLFPPGTFPPLRGTLCSNRADDVHYLYTTGYVPEMATYEGSNIPEPIEIRPDEQCESNRDKLCREILFLTKLDWNTSDFAIKEPVTLKVSRKVSNVLSDSHADPDEADKQYFYYM